jgi:hypothetical protein
MSIKLKEIASTQMNEKLDAAELIPLIELCIHQINEDSSKINKLEKRVACLEKEQRRKNIVLFGVPTKANLNSVVDDVILKKLSRKKQPPQEEIIKRGFGQKDAPQRPILIRFKKESDKERVMKQAPTLNCPNAPFKKQPKVMK